MTVLKRLGTQLDQNLLAIISLIIAITALSYNSWRNEQSEENRNLRAAGFEMMREAAQLQLIIDTVTYSDSSDDAQAIKGWVSVNLMLSLSELMTDDVNQKAEHLKVIWSENWSVLFEDKNANLRVSSANADLIQSVRQHLLKLN